jgi:asparagine synthetase B (glutamine-hydrolysing)
MHVIAGVAGQGLPQPSRHLARLAIDAQSIYATGQSKIGVLGAAAFAETSPRKSTACPFAFVDPQRWLIVADVRLDKRAELLARIGEGCGDAAIDDGSILLASWVRWGAAGLDLIVGEYAFAIDDGLSRTLVLARDIS